MKKIPPDPPLPTLPGTIPINSRLRLLTSFTSEHELGSSSSGPVHTTREQLLRAKQLLLQIKELTTKSEELVDGTLSQNLALLRLTIRALEHGELSISHLNDVRLVLDEVNRQLNQHSLQRRNTRQDEQRRLRLTEWFETAINKDSWPMETIRDLAMELYREYLYLSPPLNWYRALPEEPFLWAASHGLNTAQVLQRMLHPLRHSSRQILNAILAGLLHDLGMARLPIKVLTAQIRTDANSKQQWRTHATWLAERLRPHLRPEEFDVAQAIAQHHERLDGTGYPHQERAETILELSKRLAVADSYAALCQVRPHRQAHTTRSAIQLVLKEAQSGRLDHLAAILLLPWGLAPVGSQVELSDGARGEVISWAHVPVGSSIFRPVISLNHQQDKIVDLDLVRDRHITRVLQIET